jgi:hypothetical protein
MNSKAVYFGVTRFSIYAPGSSAWNISGNQESEYLKNLYSDERLETRFNIFLNYALPIYENYHHRYTYKHILLYSDAMPEKWKLKLFQAKRQYSFLELCVVRESIQFMDVMESFLQSERNEDCPVALFRVDDDDILSADYVDQLSNYTDTPFNGMSVSFGSGIAARYTNGTFDDFRDIRKPLLAIGLASIGHFNANTKRLHLPRAVSHVQTDLYRPVILDSRKPTFIWTHHKFQDSDRTEITATGLSKINKDYLSLKSCNNKSTITRFPSIVHDFDQQQKAIETVSNFSDSNFQSFFEFNDPGLSKAGGRYRIFFDLTSLNQGASDSKAFILYLKNGADKLSDVPGMTLSSNKNIGWYRYLNASAGEAKGYFDIYILENTGIDSIFLQTWSLNEKFSVNKLTVEKIR